MLKVLIGLVLGIVVCGAVVYYNIPDFKQNAYNTGYNAGIKAGVDSGTTAGITKGIAEIQAKEQHERDSIALVTKQDSIAKANAKPKHIVHPVQNWHVIDGKIADPVTNKPEEKPAENKDQ